MKNLLLKNTSIAIIALICGTNVFGQIGDVGKFLAGGKKDAQLIMGEYIKPYTNAFGYDLNAGWYNTAKAHKLLGFDLTFSLNTSIIPKADNTFDVDALKLSGTVTGTNSKTAPTISGAKENGPLISYSAAGHTLASYNTPQGTNWGYIPAPMVQLGLGLVYGTEIMVRYIPDIKVGSFGKVGLWGVGIKHSLKQWIPVIDHVPFLHLSVMGGYTQLHSAFDIDVKPSMLGSNVENRATLSFSNQQLDLKVKSFTANAIVSIDIPVITVYAGVGISSTKTEIQTLGNYALTPKFDLTKQVAYVDNSVVETNPINMTLNPGISPRLNGGLRIKMAVITITFDYTYANYSVVTAGLGVSVR
jgi:hypothetical protein